jgi:hypothetical protein
VNQPEPQKNSTNKPKTNKRVKLAPKLKKKKKKKKHPCKAESPKFIEIFKTPNK